MVARRRRRARGMTLIEVMIALLITTVGLLGALAMVGTGVKGSNFSRMATEASVLAQSKLEELVSTTVGTSGTLPTPSCSAAPCSAGCSMTENVDSGGATYVSTSTGPQYTRSWCWTSYTTSNAIARQIQVTVTWTDALNGSHSVYASRIQDLQ